MDMMNISFPAGVQVKANHNGFEIITDQPEKNGGGNNAPSPFDLFLVSLGTCAGFFALRFCQQRELATDDMSLSLTSEINPETKKLERVEITLNLPQDFPEKYRNAIVRAIDQCTVKKALMEPPDIDVVTV